MHEGQPHLEDMSMPPAPETGAEAADPAEGHEGAKPIFASIGTLAEHHNEVLDELMKWKSVPGVEDLYFAEAPESLDKKGILNAGDMTYLISPVDAMNKFSAGYFNCTGLIVAGVDKATHENISFVSHQDPENFLHTHYDTFLEDLRARIREIKQKSADNTIDAAIVGGNYLEDEGRKKYLESIAFLTEVVEEELGKEPFVLVGPKTEDGCDSLYYDNAHRRAYLVRHEKGSAIHPGYAASRIQDEKDKW